MRESTYSTLDIRKCRGCIYWSSNTYLCTHIIETGRKREHDGKECYSFVSRDTGKKRRRRRAKTEVEVLVPAISPLDAYRMWLQHMT